MIQLWRDRITLLLLWCVPNRCRSARYIRRYYWQTEEIAQIDHEAKRLKRAFGSDA